MREKLCVSVIEKFPVISIQVIMLYSIKYMLNVFRLKEKAPKISTILISNLLRDP